MKDKVEKKKVEQKAIEVKQAFFEAKVINEEGRIKVYLTKQLYDRDGEILDIQGVQLENFLKNPKMLWNHRIWNAEIEDVLGSWVETQKAVDPTDNVPVIQAFADFTDAHPKAQYAKRMAQQGHLSTVSVGYRIISYNHEENKVTEWELYEASWVPIPANVGAEVVEKGLKPVLDKGVKDFDEKNYKKLLAYEKIKPKIKMYRSLFLSKEMCDTLGYTKTESELVDIKRIAELMAEKLLPKQEAPAEELQVKEAPTPEQLQKVMEAVEEVKATLQKMLL